MVSPESRTLFMARHGKSKPNEQKSDQGLFEGGAPDDIPDEGQAFLVRTGIRQAQAIGFALSPFSIEWIATSPLYRARETSSHLIETYSGNPEGPIMLMGLREVSHGILERQSGVTIPEADAYRAISVKAMELFLASLHVNDNLIKKHAGWLAATGLGDGESYLDVACRASSDFDHSFIGSQPNGLLVGHNGSLRGLRVLGTALTLEERIRLRQHHSEIIPAQEQSRMIIQSIQTERQVKLNAEEMAAIIDSNFDSVSAEKLLTIVNFLEKHKVPAIYEMLGKEKRIPNGVVAKLHIRRNGKMDRDQLVIPKPPKDGNEPLTANNVEIILRPYTSTSPWV